MDDQIATTQAMKVAKHCTDVLKKEVLDFEKKLSNLQATLEAMLKV